MAADDARSPSSTGAAPAAGAGRRLGLAVLAGVAVAVVVLAIGFAVIAIPFYALASTDPRHGVDRPFIRTGLLRVALPVGLVLGTAAGVTVARWYRKGGQLPED